MDGLVKLAKGESRLPHEEAARRAAKIALVLTDSDGVLTDNGVYYGEHGEVLKRFSIRDGMGVERLRSHAIDTGIMTGETSPSVKARAEKLRIRHLSLGIKDKRAALDRVLEETGHTVDQLAYVGDDVNDLAIASSIAERGLTATPADGMPEMVRAVHYRCKARGGHGAFRDFAEWILGLRGVRTQLVRGSE
jgi:3-deoxy-D-manno-octulosonate 8-phosphate phosphatase (KDO 8-P phosphatase)